MNIFGKSSLTSLIPMDHWQHKEEINMHIYIDTYIDNIEYINKLNIYINMPVSV